MAGNTTQHGVLVGVDGSPSSAAAVAWAARDAAMRNLALTLVHIVPRPVSAVAPWPELPLPDNYVRWQDEEAKRVVEEAREIVEDSTGDDGPASVDSMVVDGPAVATLIDLSKDADIIVVGCQGKGALSRALLGSVSTGLVHHAHCPVAVVRAEGSDQPERAPVLVGVDGSEASERATEIAFDQAARRGVELVALHAWRDVSVLEFAGADFEAMETHAQTTLAERLAGFQERYPDVTVRRMVVFDRPAHQLIEQSSEAQLVVVGSHGRGGFVGMLLGSVSTAVVHAVSTPVIVART